MQLFDLRPYSAKNSYLYIAILVVKKISQKLLILYYMHFFAFWTERISSWSATWKSVGRNGVSECHSEAR